MAPLFPASIAAEDFRIGQLVRWVISDRQISPYVGKICAIYPAIQKLDVIFPIGGKQQRAPEELLPITPFSDMGYVVGPESMESNNYSGFNEEEPPYSQTKGVSGQSLKVAKLYFTNKIAPLFEEIVNYYHFGLDKSDTLERIYKKHASKFGEGSIKDAVNYIYSMKIASQIDYNSVLVLVQDILKEKDQSKRKNLVNDGFAIIFNGTGANLFVDINDILDEAYSCEEEEGILTLMRRAVGRAGGDLKNLASKKNNEDKGSADRYQNEAE